MHPIIVAIRNWGRAAHWSQDKVLIHLSIADSILLGLELLLKNDQQKSSSFALDLLDFSLFIWPPTFLLPLDTGTPIELLVLL